MDLDADVICRRVLASLRSAGWTAWMMPAEGITRGGVAKFMPSARMSVSADASERWLRLTTVCRRNASLSWRWAGRGVGGGCLWDIEDPLGLACWDGGTEDLDCRCERWWNFRSCLFRDVVNAWLLEEWVRELSLSKSWQWRDHARAASVAAMSLSRWQSVYLVCLMRSRRRAWLSAWRIRWERLFRMGSCSFRPGGESRQRLRKARWLMCFERLIEVRLYSLTH